MEFIDWIPVETQMLSHNPGGDNGLANMYMLSALGWRYLRFVPGNCRERESEDPSVPSRDELVGRGGRIPGAWLPTGVFPSAGHPALLPSPGYNW